MCLEVNIDCKLKMLAAKEFLRHFTPGLVFISFGTWWLVLIASWTSIRRRLLRRKVYADEDKSWSKLLKSGKLDRCSLPLPCRVFQIISLEGLLKLIASIAGIVVTIAADTRSIVEIQYATVYLFFGLSGFADIISCFDAAPPGADYFLLSLAYSVEAGIIYSHNTVPGSFEEVLQNVQVVLVIFCVISTLIEMKTRRNFSFRLLRSYLTIVQGVWFIQAGILFHVDYFSWVKEDSENHWVWISIILAWICGAVFFYSFFVYVFVYLVARVCWCCRLSSITKNQNSVNSNIYKRSVGEDDEMQSLADDY